MKKIYIIEENVHLLEMLKTIVQECILGHEVIGTANNGQQAMKDGIALEPDLFILDFNLPEADGDEVLNFIKTNLPQSKVMLYSEQNDQKTIEITLQGKADGHMIKGSRIEEIVYAIKKVTRGDHYFSSVFHKHKFSSKL